MLLKTGLFSLSAPQLFFQARRGAWRFALFSGVAFFLCGGAGLCQAEALDAREAGRSVEAAAQALGPRVLLRWGTHDSFDRFAFDMPDGVSEKGKVYEISRTDDQVVVRFFFSADARLPSVRGAQRFAQAHVVREDGAFLLRFRVDPRARLTDRLEGRVFVLDVAGPVVGAGVLASPSPVVMPSPSPSPSLTPVPVPAVSLTPRPEPSPVPSLVAGEVLASPSPAPVVVVSATPLPVQTVATWASLNEARSVPPNAPLDLKAKSEIVASFDAKTPVGAVVFVRGGFVTVLFDRKISIPPQTLVGGAPLRVRLYPVDLPRNAGFRFAVPLGAEVSVARDQTAWKISFSKQALDASFVSNLIAQPDFALGARLLLPMANPPEPVYFTDPVVGDSLILIPTLEAQTFPVARALADLNLLPTAQGIVVKPLQERVVVRRVTDGLEITAEGGLRLSPSVDTGSESGVGASAGHSKLDKRLFDLSAWHGKADEAFTKKLQRLQQNIVEVQPKDRLLARLELARFYFSYGMAEEALSILGLLEKDEPDFGGHTDYLALRGATRILTRQVPEGLQDLSIPALSDLRETDLWKAVGFAEMRDWGRAYEKFFQVQDLLKSYPKPFRTHFVVLATEAALAVGKDKEANAWLAVLQEVARKEDDVVASIAYLKGALASRAGDADKAAVFWREAAKGKDRLYKIRAELALIDLAVATHSLTPAQAAARLEGLRFAWRGDDLELDILNRLGGFYMDARNHRAGLQIYGLALRLYPNAPMSAEIREAMTGGFRNLFLGDEADKLSPIEALTIYQEFAYLKPKGEGVQIGRKLVERLVAIDLLDQAARILEIQLKNGLPPEERGAVGTRLAGIYLLDHSADKALAALAASEPEAGAPAFPAGLVGERLLLRARALLEQKKVDEALGLLANNASMPARLLRADVLMKGERWGEAAKALVDLAGAPPKAGDPSLTAAQADILVNAAIAASLAQDMGMLDQLASSYGAAMEKTGLKDMFRVLTRPDKVGQVADLRAASARIADVDMFRKVLDTYRGGQEDQKAP